MYNNEQLSAINAAENKIVVIAPPGSGKTHTMVGAIEHFIKTTSPTKVVAITFTKKAAEELKSRLFAIDNVLHVATIHSWSLAKLNELSVKHKFRVKLLEELQIMEILKPFMDEYNIAVRSRYSCYYHVMGNINPDLDIRIKAKFDAIREKYIKYKRDRHLYDFTDLPLYLKVKLEDYNEFIEADGLFVDEFQDVDPDQLEVFNRVVAAKKFYIGDPDQSIYLFRGATQEIFSKIKDFTVYKLSINYRSYQPIVDFASSFKLGAKDDTSITDAVYTPLGIIRTIRGENPNKDFTVMISYRSKMRNPIDGTLISAKSFLQDQLEKVHYQVLCRTNREAKELIEFGLTNAMTIHQAKGLEFKNVLVVDFMVQSEEDINIAYVALTRAEDKLVVANYDNLIYALEDCNKEKLQNTSSNLSVAF